MNEMYLKNDNFQCSFGNVFVEDVSSFRSNREISREHKSDFKCWPPWLGNEGNVSLSFA